MDLLKQELARKKKLLQEASSAGTLGNSNQKKSRYLRAGDLRRREEQAEEEAEERSRRSNSKSKKRSRSGATAETSNEPTEAETIAPTTLAAKIRNTAAAGAIDESMASTNKKRKNSTNTTTRSTNINNNNNHHQLEKLSSQEITMQLRLFGLPIRLFGEVDHDENSKNDTTTKPQRLVRLQEALTTHKANLAQLTEQDEFRLGRGHQIRNTFLEKEEGAASFNNAVDDNHNNEVGNNNNNNNHSKKGTSNQHETNDKDSKKKSKKEGDDDYSDDPHKRVYSYFKNLLRQWEQGLLERPDDAKLTLAGRNETKTHKQCKDYIKPLFKLCKHRRVEESLLNNLVRMVDYCQQGEFVKAHDAYLDVAIGRAAWPIGVTQVGIHSRTGRSKIASDTVAHVMNSELQRKYLTSVKRLMTYAQSLRADVTHSKKVL